MKYIFLSMILAGAVVVLGSAGATDLNIVNIETSILQALVGVGLVVIGFRGLEVLARGDRG